MYALESTKIRFDSRCPTLLIISNRSTVRQNSQESGRKYWTTRSFVHSLAPLTHLLARSLIRFAHALCYTQIILSLPSSWESEWFVVSKRPGFAPRCEGLSISDGFSVSPFLVMLRRKNTEARALNGRTFSISTTKSSAIWSRPRILRGFSPSSMTSASKSKAKPTWMKNSSKIFKVNHVNFADEEEELWMIACWLRRTKNWDISVRMPAHPFAYLSLPLTHLLACLPGWRSPLCSFVRSLTHSCTWGKVNGTMSQHQPVLNHGGLVSAKGTENWREKVENQGEISCKIGQMNHQPVTNNLFIDFSKSLTPTLLF